MNDKFLFVLTCFLGGGTETVFLEIANHLIDKEKNVYLFVVNNFEPSKFNINKRITIIKSMQQAKRIAKEKCTVINFSGDWKSGFYARIFLKKIISWVHCNPYTMKSAKTSFINFWILKHSQHVVCVCNEQKKILQNEFGFQNQISSIYNAVNLDRIQKMTKEKNPYQKKKYILMAARFDNKSKDFKTLINAYSLFCEELQNEYDLILLGNGKSLKELVDYVKEKKLEDKIFFPGFDNNPYKWMKYCSCFVLSSKTEGFSLVPLEAIACGAPVVFTNYHTGSIEVSENGKSAVLVNIGDAPKMSEAISKILINDKYREKLIMNANHHLKNFTIEFFYQKIDELFGL